MLDARLAVANTWRLKSPSSRYLFSARRHARQLGEIIYRHSWINTPRLPVMSLGSTPNAQY